MSSSGTVAPSGAVAVPVPPVALTLLSRGAAVEARVLGPGDAGLTRLEEVIGGAVVEVDAHLALPLPGGAVLSLKVMQAAAGEAATLRLTAINGRSLALALADPTLGARAAVATSSSGVAETVAAQPGGVVAATSTIGVGRPIPALVLQGDVMRDPQGQSEILIPGTRLAVRLTQFILPEVGGRGVLSAPSVATQGVPPGGAAPTVSIATPAAGLVAASESLRTVVQAAARYAAIGRIAPPPAGDGAPLPGLSSTAPLPVAAAPSFPASAAPMVSAAGHPGNMPVAASAASPTASPTLPSVPVASVVATPAASAPGVLISHSALGQPTVQTAAGFIALDVRAPLPSGTQVSFEILARAPAEVGMPLPFGGLGQASPWTTLDALWQSLAQADPEGAARLAAALPQPGAQMLSNLTAAMAAVRSGDAQAWLGLADTLQRAQTREDARVGKLAQRLSEDLREASRGARRPEGEWRVYSLPFMVGGAVERIHILVRRAPNSEDEEEENRRKNEHRNDMRFLLDISLSHLGPMQIDGLVNAVAHSLDLIIRTRQALPEPIPTELRGVFAETMAAVGYTGSLGLRVTPDFVIPEGVAEDGPARPGVVV